MNKAAAFLSRVAPIPFVNKEEMDRILGYSGLGSEEEENDDALDWELREIERAEAKRERDHVHYGESRM
jgi:hypothetical protein